VQKWSNSQVIEFSSDIFYVIVVILYDGCVDRVRMSAGFPGDARAVPVTAERMHVH